MARSSNMLKEFIKNRAAKKELLAQIARLAQEQAGYIKEEATDQLLLSIREREQLAKKIDLLDAQNESLALWLKEQMGDEHNALATSDQQMLALAKKIQVLDQSNNRFLQQQIGNYKGQLRELRQTRHVAKAYTNAYTSEEGSYFDVKQ